MLDDRDAYTPGWKFAEWELRGVPLRMEIGPKDIEKSAVMVARRDTREKASLAMDGIGATITGLLDEIQKALYERALKYREDHTQRVSTYEEFKTLMEGRPGFLIAGWCGSAECENAIKADTQATVRNIPFGAERVAGTCIKCGRPSSVEAWFAKSVLRTAAASGQRVAMRFRAALRGVTFSRPAMAPNAAASC